jgi:hypothetical protein
MKTFARYVLDEEIALLEKHLTDAEVDKREEIVKKLKSKKAEFESRYGDDAKSVMYAIATKQAKK